MSAWRHILHEKSDMSIIESCLIGLQASRCSLHGSGCLLSSQAAYLHKGRTCQQIAHGQNSSGSWRQASCEEGPEGNEVIRQPCAPWNTCRHKKAYRGHTGHRGNHWLIVLTW